ncbi:hypothetical protein JVU11DRAFT_11405 [Chiua virens]|nr:hypothetical protein JVU11DRAFT_11405 [Chiua virens]
MVQLANDVILHLQWNEDDEQPSLVESEVTSPTSSRTRLTSPNSTFQSRSRHHGPAYSYPPIALKINVVDCHSTSAVESWFSQYDNFFDRSSFSCDTRHAPLFVSLICPRSGMPLSLVNSGAIGAEGFSIRFGCAAILMAPRKSLLCGDTRCQRSVTATKFYSRTRAERRVLMTTHAGKKMFRAVFDILETEMGESSDDKLILDYLNRPLVASLLSFSFSGSALSPSCPESYLSTSANMMHESLSIHERTTRFCGQVMSTGATNGVPFHVIQVTCARNATQRTPITNPMG